MDRVDVMSNHSAPYYTKSLDILSPPPPREYIRERSYTFPRRRNKNRSDSLVSSLPLDNKLQNTCNTSLRYSSIDENNQETETMDEKWKKLKEIITEVENMKSVVDKLFPVVETAEYPDSPIDYIGSSQYEIEVELLKRTIDEQISRMKAYWSEDRPKDNNDRYQIEKMRYNIASIFKRMKVVVSGLVPSVGEFNLTKSRLDELNNQITNLEVTVTQFAQSRRSSEQFQRQRNSHNYEDESPPTYRSRTNSIRDTYNESRIRELEAELESSLQREEALQAKIKKMEEGYDKEFANMEDQLKQLYKLLDRSNLRADSASNEAFELKMKVAELTEEANTKQYQLSISKRKITELESRLADRRGSEIRTQVVQPRKSPETYFTYKKDESIYSSNAPNKSLEQSLPIKQIKSPRSIPQRRERNISTTSHTSQRSRVESPREKKQVVFYQDIPVIGNMQTGREYNNFANIQPHRYMAMA